MYPNISDLINDLFGTNIVLPAKTFGFFLAAAFVVAFFVLRTELRRREKLGHFKLRKERIRVQGPMHIRELIVFVAVWGLVGYKLGYYFVDSEEFNQHTDQILLSTKGYWLTGILALAVSGIIKYRQYAKRKDLEEKFEDIQAGPSHYIGIIVTIAFVAGILGSKLFAMIDPTGNFWSDPLGDLLSFNGLSFYGGLITAGVLICWYLYKKGFNLLTGLDAFAPCLIIAYAVGRIGCQLAGDGDWGIMNPDPQPDWLAWLPEWTWSFDYPNNVAFPFPDPKVDCMGDICNAAIPIQGCEGQYCTKLATPVFPTPFYETIMGSIIFGILWWIRKIMKYPGQVAGIYFFLNGMERFFIEKIRINLTYTFAGIEFTQAELIAVILMLGGAAMFIYAARKKKPLVVQQSG